MSAPEPPSSLRPILDALSRLRGKALGKPLLDLYLGLPAPSRTELLPVLKLHGGGLREALAERDDIAQVDALILDAALGKDPATVRAQIVELPVGERLEVVFQLCDHAELMRALPWEEWLEESPEDHIAIASQAAASSGLRQLLPRLRQLLASSPCPDLIRTLGELGDRDSVPALLALLENESLQHFRPLVFESLGRIGGPDARHALHQITLSDDEKEVRLGYKSLAQCAAEEDDEIFREAAVHPDWLVRLAAVDVLARYARPDNLEAVSTLAADPVAIVAQRALTALRTDTQ